MSNPVASSPTMHSSSQSSLGQQAQAMLSPSIVMPPSNTCGVTPLGQQQVSPVIPSTQEQLRPTPPPLIFVGQSNNYSSPTMNVPCGAASAMPTPASQSSSAVPPTTVSVRTLFSSCHCQIVGRIGNDSPWSQSTMATLTHSDVSGYELQVKGVSVGRYS